MDIVKNSLALELNSQVGEKILITPVGTKVTGVDGRVFEIEPNLVIANTKKHKTDIMLDKGHFSDEAMGWIALDSLEVRDDGIYGSLELNELGKELVDKKIFRYISPAFGVNHRENRAYEVLHIDSIGLVNRPNLVFTALNQKDNKGDGMEKRIAELEAKNSELEAENKKLSKSLEELRTLQRQNNEKAKIARVENAIKNGEMLPSRKDEALKLEGNILDSFLEVCKSEAALTLAKNSINADKPSDELDALAKKAKDNLYK